VQLSVSVKLPVAEILAIVSGAFPTLVSIMGARALGVPESWEKKFSIDAEKAMVGVLGHTLTVCSETCWIMLVLNCVRSTLRRN
jgi:hypothetical protein